MSDSDEPKKIRSIKVDYLARVEGEGAMQLHMRDGAVEDVKLKIFEPPRFFEASFRPFAFEARISPPGMRHLPGSLSMAHVMLSKGRQAS